MTGYHFKPWAIYITMLGLFALTSLDTQAALSFRTVALSGEMAPGASTVFRRFSGATINTVGNVVLSGHLPYNESGVTASGVWAEPQGELVYVASEGDSAPGYAPGVEYRSISAAFMDDAGRVTISASVKGPGIDLTNSSAIWHYSGGSSSIVMHLGQPVPGLPGAEFSGWFTPKINASGKIAIGATLQGNVTDLTNSGFWTQEAGQLQAVILEGQAAPGTTPGTVFGADGNLNAFQYFLISYNGQLLVLAKLVGNDVNERNDRGLWVEDHGSLRMVAREGDSAPGLPAHVVFGDQFDSAFILPSISDNGLVAFDSTFTLAGNNVPRSHGVWSEGGGTLHLVAREGGLPPGMGSGVVFNGFTDVNINNAGQASFFGSLAGSNIIDSNNEGLWLETDGVLAQIVRETDHAPGTPELVRFGLGSSPFYTVFSHHQLNNLGQIAFAGALLGPGVNETNDRGIWATRPDGQMVLIAREGDLYDANDDPLIEDLRTVEQIDWYGSFNDAGQVVFGLDFTDGSHGVFVATVPEPGIAFTFSVALASILTSRVRSRCSCQQSTVTGQCGVVCLPCNPCLWHRCWT